ncbi:MAG: hypothetical protein ACKVWR_21975 [Acidimicrobiales bacterium]
MPWGALSDSFCDHPKIVAMGNEAAGLYARLISYSARHLTDGVIPLEIALSYAARGDSRYAARDARELLRELHASDVARHIRGHIVITDYLQYNPTRARVEEERWRATNKKRSQRGQNPISKPAFDQLSPLLSLGLSPGDIEVLSRGDKTPLSHGDEAPVPQGRNGVSPGLSPGTRAGARDRATPLSTSTKGPSVTYEASGVVGDAPRPPRTSTTPDALAPAPVTTVAAASGQPPGQRRNVRTGNPDDPPPPPKPKLTPLDRGRNYIRNVGHTLEPGPIFEAALTAAVTDLTPTDTLELVDEHTHQHAHHQEAAE